MIVSIDSFLSTLMGPKKYIVNRKVSQNTTHIYVFDFLELILQVFGQLVRAFYRTPLASQVV